ncbi:MAG: MarR family transcriptional regulator [Fimbriimonadaceae bacterium]|nr:MarR family transcriptional regulator [Fimbriimonadaceae bacterium]
MESGCGESGGRLTDVQKAAFSAFFEAHGQLSKRIERRLEQANVVGLETYDVLLNLELAPGQRLRMRELAERIVYSRSGLTRLADRLEAQGLITRVACVHDRRGMDLVITEAGLRARSEAWRVFSDAVAELFSPHLSDPEAASIARIFRAMVSALAGNSPSPESTCGGPGPGCGEA